jgi:hypothetical protein
VTAGEIVGLLSEMPGVVVETASEATGALRWRGATVTVSRARKSRSPIS